MHVSSSSSSERVSTPNASDYDDDDVSVNINEATNNWREGRAETPEKKERQPDQALSTALKIVNSERNGEKKNEAFFSGVSPGIIAAGALSMTILAGGLATIIVGGIGTLQVPEHDRPLDIGLISAGGQKQCR